VVVERRPRTRGDELDAVEALIFLFSSSVDSNNGEWLPASSLFLILVTQLSLQDHAQLSELRVITPPYAPSHRRYSLPRCREATAHLRTSSPGRHLVPATIEPQRMVRCYQAESLRPHPPQRCHARAWTWLGPSPLLTSPPVSSAFSNPTLDSLYFSCTSLSPEGPR
jgi:hypothetical protein